MPSQGALVVPLYAIFARLGTTEPLDCVLASRVCWHRSIKARAKQTNAAYPESNAKAKWNTLDGSRSFWECSDGVFGTPGTVRPGCVYSQFEKGPRQIEPRDDDEVSMNGQSTACCDDGANSRQ